MITYNWVISQLDTAPQSEGLTDVVKVVHWRYVGEDADYRAEIYSTYSCPSPSATDFTAYPDLTEADVIGWLEAGLDVQSLKDGIDAQIENQKNPPIVNLPLPWQN
jgi:hypothetical protein